MKTVLITGATGFIGRHALRSLIERGYDVHAICRDTIADANSDTSQNNEASEFGLSPKGRPTWHTCDLLAGEADALCKSVRATHLLHFAWIATPGVYWTSPENKEWVERTLSLVKTFRENGGTRAVLAGTCAEYDWSDLPDCIAEDAPIKPATLYGECKNETRERAESFARENGLSLAWGRIFFLYGPHEPKERLVPSVINSLLAGQEARTTSGEQIRDFLHVSDVANAFVTLLDSEVQRAVNIASGNAAAVKDVVMEIARIIGKPELVRLGAKPIGTNEPPRIVADIARLSNEVGWTPRYTLEEGLKQTIRWWQARTK
jgi:nucleoside-diphosphate-sugar epimerase